MAASMEYRQLKKRLNELQRHLLPKNFSPTGNYSRRVLDRTRAYRLLAHAEFESYFEERVRKIAIQAVNSWKTTGRANNVIISLCVFSGILWDAPPTSLSEGSKKPIELTEKRVDYALQVFLNRVLNNNGIKEKHLLQLLLPIGIEPQDLDITWLNAMNSFGQNRGLTAHTSARIQPALDPADEYKTVQYLLTELRTLDEKLNRLLARR